MSDAVASILASTPVFLAPMAGISDVPFRSLALRHGAGLVVSEMVASGEMLNASPSARARAELGLDEARTSVQLAGREPGPMAEAARMLAGQGARIIDINMGCPAKKVTGGLAGAALMRDLDRALVLIEAVVGAVGVPVTLKMRLGWDGDCLNAAVLAARAEAAGVRMIVVHGRTRAQFYDGRADWSAVAAVRRAVGIPVIVNGDVADADGAREALARSGADGVMVGRAARGRPWVVGRIAAALRGETPAAEPEGAALRDAILEHYEAMLGFYGADLGLRVARKHLGWYLDRVEGGGALRARVLRMGDPRAVAVALGAVADLAPSLDAAA
ncbi:tRNA dihydrouridine synthase DusB [Amaricoccus sp.]|uniref:tRNA dihydrouridine synthase DusB n=1 Tax=Amaricoccus sp. TaxID=1872485 RepID=UPI001B6FC81B|nr:tRNA dihydrouridine synthase DusB [Amaricoccus sp.]MBP7241362.1 tRNA dihydrouridine synthase DusB [Amaricoccus sp.]